MNEREQRYNDRIGSRAYERTIKQELKSDKIPY